MKTGVAILFTLISNRKTRGGESIDLTINLVSPNHNILTLQQSGDIFTYLPSHLGLG